ncbi:DDHD domain-containing protein [Aphelenchoides fujianensis]|nr:DDHD domain-containing protein [Aphelenchoides fujianensis]
MLLKEYRILLPMTVDEYRIAQLYMIQKKSRIDSSAWIRSILPSSALEAVEEAWNAYPFTKTRYSSPMLDRLQVDVETVYLNDAGTQENVFKLSKDELKQRVVDVMDFVNDPISSHDYVLEEDPREYRSKKTGRGPLSTDWIEEYTRSGKPIMCSYKLCRVEFRYWGMQTRVERWIHDLALRNTMLRAHRQAWAWQDEWDGLTIADIRRLENEAALYLQQVMKPGEKSAEPTDSDDEDSTSDIFFDCLDQSPPHSQKPSLIRWSSELLIGEGDSPPQTPKPDPSSALLVLVFHGDIYPESPADSKTTDANTLRSTIDALISSHYVQLKNRVHVQRVICGSELCTTVASLNAVCSSFGSFHPSLALLIATSETFYEAVQGTIRRANEVVANFLRSEAGANFNGEIYAVGDCIGGLLMYEALARPQPAGSIIPESNELDSANWSAHESSASPPFDHSPNMDSVFGNENEPVPSPISAASHSQPSPLPIASKSFPRNLSAPPSASYLNRKKMSTSSIDGALQELKINTNAPQSINFKPSTAFLLGCPLALVLMQRKMQGREADQLECEQLFNLFYSLDSCGARLEPRYPLGDGRHIFFDSALETSTLWGSRRIDHQLYCPAEMVSLPSAALPNILHASYWESKDVGAFILRQFVRPLNVEMPPASWNRRRTRFKIVNLSANHRANDIITVEGSDLVINARFCYGPMDLVALSREEVIVFVCPSGGEWYQQCAECTDAHGRLNINLGKQLPVGIHAVKMIVRGDHSFLNMYIAVVPPATRCVVFSIDGSLTGSVSVTGRDPRVRAGAVDVVRYWQQQGYIIIYVTARPDMQQRVVGAWLAQHNFPHGLLFFTPSISTDPLKQKTQHIRRLVDIGLQIQAAYGSSKDVAVYTAAGVDAEHIFKVSGSRRRGCVSLEDGYAQHLHDLHAGRVAIAQSVVHTVPLINEGHFFTPSNQQNTR